MSIVKALKAFFKKLTGKDVNGGSIYSTIMNGTAEMSIPEPELPDVTAADNGKVLTVVNGEWDKGNPGTGYTITKVAFEQNPGGGVTANMTVAEALAAMENGPVFATCKVPYGADTFTICFGTAVPIASSDGLAFLNVSSGQGDVFSVAPGIIGTMIDGWSTGD